jgi:hypothetical protein
MNVRSRIATAARVAGRRFCMAFGLAPAIWSTKPDDDFPRKMTLFLVIVIAALALVLVRKLMGCYP